MELSSTSFALPSSSTSGISSTGTSWSRCGLGQTVVLLHGVGMNKSVWGPQVLNLCVDFDVLVYDMWGHGDSTLQPTTSDGGELTLADYTNQLLLLLAELKISSVHVVGHSMGALIALDFALQHPQQCLSVSALNSVFNRTAEQGAAVKKRAADLAINGNLPNVEETLLRWFGKPESPENVAAEMLTRKMLLAIKPQSYSKAYGVFATSDQVHLESLKSLAVPALFFTADGDPNSTPIMSQAMADLAPHSQVEILIGHRHMMTLTAPEEVNASLRSFFNSVTNPSKNQED